MNKKRLLSFFVAMCMIVALIPAGIAPAAAADPIVINLNRGSATADLTLNATPTLATFASGCGFEVATVDGATNIKNLIAQSNCILVQGNANNSLAVLKVKAPAGEYKVSIKVPDMAAGANAGILNFKIGGVIGDKAYRYTGGTDLGDYNFAASGAMGATHTFENTVTLTGEEHQLAISFKQAVAAGSGYAWGAIESLIFTPVEEEEPDEPVVPDTPVVPDEPEDPSEPVVVSLNRGNATADLNLTTNPGDATFANGCGFEVATTASGAVNYKTMAANEGYINFQLVNGQYTLGVIKIKVPAGTYKVSMKIPTVTRSVNSGVNNAGPLAFSIGGQISETKANTYIGGTKLGEVDFASYKPSIYAISEAVHTFENTVTLTGEEHQLAITLGEGVGAGAWVWGVIESLTFTPVEPKAEIPESEIFGDTYAYVKDGTVYFLGGLKVIEGYTEVGFEVSVNGGAAECISTSEVYEEFAVTAQNVSKTAADWDSEYIFVTSKSGLKAGDVVTLKPYVANGEAKTFHGELELKLSI